MSYSTHPLPIITNFWLQLLLALLSYCRAEICLLAMWAKRGRINETLSDSSEVTHMVYLVISPSLLLSSLILFYFPTGHLAFSCSSFPSAVLPTLHTSGVAAVTGDRCSMPVSQTQNVGQQMYTHTCHMHYTVTAAPRRV